MSETSDDPALSTGSNAFLKKAPLDQRFGQFIKTFRGFESIDVLLKKRPHPKKERADYLVWDRRVIIEQKRLMVDPAEKPRAFGHNLMRERGFIAWGTHSLNNILSGLPDEKTLRYKLALNVTQSIGNIISKADNQIRDTKEIFGIHRVSGILIILNEDAPTFSPDVIAYRLEQMFSRPAADGSPLYTNLSMVIVISEAHTVSSPATPAGTPISAFRIRHWHNDFTAPRFARELRERWAEFNGVPLVINRRFSDATYRPRTEAGA